MQVHMIYEMLQPLAEESVFEFFFLKYTRALNAVH